MLCVTHHCMAAPFRCTRAMLFHAREQSSVRPRLSRRHHHSFASPSRPREPGPNEPDSEVKPKKLPWLIAVGSLLPNPRLHQASQGGPVLEALQALLDDEDEGHGMRPGEMLRARSSPAKNRVSSATTPCICRPQCIRLSSK